jgi:hypothetical protein
MNPWKLTSLTLAAVLAFGSSVAIAQTTTTDKPAGTTADKPATSGTEKSTSRSTTSTITTAPSTERPGVVRTDVTAITAVVEAVDPDKRTVTLKGPRGVVMLQVGPEVKNLDQVKVGDKVRAKYLESVALFVRKAGDAPPDAAQIQGVKVAPKGQKPMAAAVDTVEVSARVEKIDYEKRLITLKGPEGNVKTLKVDPAVKRLNEVKVGDDIVLRHTQAIAIGIVPPGKS